jgi:hypothetical protein
MAVMAVSSSQAGAPPFLDRVRGGFVVSDGKIGRTRRWCGWTCGSDSHSAGTVV